MGDNLTLLHRGVRCGKCGNGLGHEFVGDGSSLKFVPKGTGQGNSDQIVSYIMQ
uniref:L-methionine (R)-S-oxide reductase n=1 Tax=Salmo trutta TaxID=8032 RepID=A0A673WEK8_SALTR